jgi:hypothetical protein
VAPAISTDFETLLLRHRQGGDQFGLVNVIRSLCEWLEQAGQSDDAARLEGWSATNTVVRSSSPVLAQHGRTVGRLADSLGSDRLAILQAEGRACTPDQIVAIAIAAIDRVTSEERQNNC